ncbi:Glutathione S-transferase GstB [Raoultella planticola]|uniref:Glutathione S-transferase GstB n=1 Tax=Raoultella planticola TaxID=575 RepID=A0A485AT38_RAOPL|nr:Glutathione S-transferase GstB [Raoultella planticola]
MITLWGRNNSTNVKKVRWVLAELGLPYQHIMAGLEFGLNHDPEYLAMNPNGLVPLLKDDASDLVLWGIECHYSLSGRRVWPGSFMGHIAAQTRAER